jgi:hypothetical protein
MINNFKNEINEDCDIYDVKLSGNGKEYRGYKIVSADGSVIYIVRELGNSIVVIILGDDEKAVKDLTRGVGNGVPSYLKQEIYVLPKDMPSKYHLEFLRCKILDEDYARERGYSEWAEMLVGKWCFDSWWSDDNGNYITIINY